MWRPGFAFVEARPALLRGYHRAFCVYSLHYRGTPARPGLVLGLDRGGACRGIAFRVAAGRAAETLAYVDRREQITTVYERRLVPVRLAAATVRAYTYVADRGHPQYAGKLSEDEVAAIIGASAGVAGTNRAYLESTVAHLDAMGVRETTLHRLLARLRRPGAETPPRARGAGSPS
ncbi:MAG: gamma-glutamylcyclotransferase [Proteobacteria bacterium]|nr:gamma-glutamylcyclotransferase [Pseudomonadota bacterium]